MITTARRRIWRARGGKHFAFLPLVFRRAARFGEAFIS
jgi:hypothetical protein